MNIYEAIKKNSIIKESSSIDYNKEVLDNLKSVNAKEIYDFGFDSFLTEMLNADDFQQYCDYAYEATSASDVSMALKDLIRIFTERVKADETRKKQMSDISVRLDTTRAKIDDYLEDLSKFLKDKGAKVSIKNYQLEFDFSNKLDKLVGSLDNKAEELYNKMTTYSGRGDDQYEKYLSGSFSMLLCMDLYEDPEEDLLDRFDEFNYQIWLHQPLLKFISGEDYRISKYRNGTLISDLSNNAQELIDSFKENINKILSVNLSDYEKYLDENIIKYDNKINRRQERLANNKKKAEDKFAALSSGDTSVKVSTADVIKLLNQQVPNIPSNIYNSTYGNFRIKGILPDGHMASLTIRLLGGKTPGTFEYGLSDVKRNPDFINHCTEEIAKALSATKTADRRDIMSKDAILKCYKAPLKNLSELPKVVQKLNSELKEN